MRICCHRQELYDALKLISHVTTAARSALPILQHILIATHGTDRLHLLATDLEIGVEYALEASVEQEGSATVSARALLSWLRLHQGEESITLQTEAVEPLPGTEKTFLLVDDLVSFACRMDVEAFPRLKRPVHLAKAVRCPAQLLKKLILQVAFAASADVSDTVLSNVWVHFGKEKMSFAAGEASRCALRTVPLPGATEALFLTPARTFKKIARLLPRAGEVRIEVDERKSLLCVHAEGIDFLVRLVDPQARPYGGEDPVRRYTQDGELRPFEPFLPKRSPTHVTVSREALQTVMSKRLWPVSCGVCEGPDQAYLTLTVYQPDSVQTHTLPAQLQGPGFANRWISLGSLADALACPVKSEWLVLGFGLSPTDTVLLRWMDQKGKAERSYAYAFAPMHPVSALQHTHVRRALLARAAQFLSQWPGQRIDRGSHFDLVLEETLYLIVSMCEGGVAPTEAEIKRSLVNLTHLSDKHPTTVQEACARQYNEVARELAIGSFAPGGSSLETLVGPLVFKADEVRSVLSGM